MAEKSYTVTTDKTFRLLEKGFSLEQIAQIRQLKLSTIEDHLVEISLHDHSFLLDEYVKKEHRVEIEKAVQKLKTKQLKKLKEFLNNENISYFHIRLVLTKIGDHVET